MRGVSKDGRIGASWFESREDALLVLDGFAILCSFHEERPAPDGHLERVADRRIVRSKAFWAAGEQDRDRLFIGPGWLKEPGVRITRKGRGRWVRLTQS